MVFFVIVQPTSCIEPELAPEAILIGEVGTYFDLIQCPMVLHIDVIIDMSILHCPVIDRDEPHK